MSPCKLTYFNLMGLGEPIRMMLSYMGKDFEDNRIERSDWPGMKSSMPFGKLPVLEMDGKKMHQSAAICRYLGKQCGLAGKDDWESLQIDMIVDAFQDLRLELVKYVLEQDPQTKEKKKETLVKEILPDYLGKFDANIKENGGYLANKSLSWGDIYICSAIDSFIGMMKIDILEKFPNIMALKDKVFSVPKIKAWIDKRPKSEF